MMVLVSKGHKQLHWHTLGTGPESPEGVSTKGLKPAPGSATAGVEPGSVAGGGSEYRARTALDARPDACTAASAASPSRGIAYGPPPSAMKAAAGAGAGAAAAGAGRAQLRRPLAQEPVRPRQARGLLPLVRALPRWVLAQEPALLG